jgi:para-nitrobenzyl esterase
MECSDMPLDIMTTAGVVRAHRASETVVAALGIPYAAPPFGERRFAAPAPPQPWSGVRECDRFGPIAPQNAAVPGGPAWTPGEEDVLSLNVWAPADAEDLPVLVWLHGGAFILGSSGEPMYEGTRLAEAGLVVVTCNYRLGFEGYGHAPGYPDNRALLDQRAALAWVQENIGAFGGDPDRVTIAGQSAGGASVACLMAMPQARGLFHRAIAHSVPATYLPKEIAAVVSERIAQAAGVPLDQFAELPPEKLLAATTEVISAHQEHQVAGFQSAAVTVFAPVIDGKTLPAAPLQAAADSGVPLLTLHTMDEYRLFAFLDPSLQVTEEALDGVAAQLRVGPEAVRAYRKLYPQADPRELFCAMKGDALFTEYTVRLAEAHAAAGHPAYVSRLALASGALDGWLGSCHALDLPLAFGNSSEGLGAFLLDGLPAEAVAALSARMIGAWADFARTGDPG